MASRHAAIDDIGTETTSRRPMSAASVTTVVQPASPTAAASSSPLHHRFPSTGTAPATQHAHMASTQAGEL